jgi:hypothetical protein
LTLQGISIPLDDALIPAVAVHVAAPIGYVLGERRRDVENIQ